MTCSVQYSKRICCQQVKNLRQFHQVLSFFNVPADYSTHPLEDWIGNITMMVVPQCNYFLFEDLFSKSNTSHKTFLGGIFAFHDIEQTVDMERKITVTGQELIP